MKNILLIIAILAIFVSTNPANRFTASNVNNIYVATIYTTQFGDTLVGMLNNVISVAQVKDFLFEYPEF